MLRILLCLTVVIPFSFGCVGDMKTMEKGDGNASRKVLIAGTESDFKEKVVEAVVQKLMPGEYYVKITGLGSLEQEDLSPYGAIVLIGPMMAGRIDRHITGWLKDHPSDPRAIVFYTRGSDDPQPEWAKPKLGVDAVSGASVDSRVDQHTEELVSLIGKRF